MAATAAVSEGTSTTDVLETDEARTMLEAAQAAGRISAEEIALSLDELDLEPAQLEDVYRALEELQIEIVDSEPAEPRRSRRRRGSTRPRARSRPTRCSCS